MFHEGVYGLESVVTPTVGIFWKLIFCIYIHEEQKNFINNHSVFVGCFMASKPLLGYFIPSLVIFSTFGFGWFIGLWQANLYWFILFQVWSFFTFGFGWFIGLWQANLCWIILFQV